VCSITEGKCITQLIDREMIEKEDVSLCSLIRVRHMEFGLDLNNAGSRSTQARLSPVSRVETGIYREVKSDEVNFRFQKLLQHGVYILGV
jgi:hypothetical protein